MVGAKSRREAVRAFYEDHLKGLEFGSAVADVILVPLLALSLIGAIDIPGSTGRTIVAIFAFIDVTSTAVLLVAGYAGREPKIACANCKGRMVPSVSFWACEGCGAHLRLRKPGSQSTTSISKQL